MIHKIIKTWKTYRQDDFFVYIIIGMCIIILLVCCKSYYVYDECISGCENVSSFETTEQKALRFTNGSQLGIGNYSSKAEITFLTYPDENNNSGALSWNGTHFDFKGNVTVGAEVLIEVMNDINERVCNEILSQKG